MEMGYEVSQNSTKEVDRNRETQMKTTTLAGEIANYSIYQLKNGVIQIREMAVIDQDNVRDIIRNAALYVLDEHVGSPKRT
jgi:hypothetical protein